MNFHFSDIAFVILLAVALWQIRYGFFSMLLILSQTLVVFLATVRFAPAIAQTFTGGSPWVYSLTHLGTMLACSALVYFFFNPVSVWLRNSRPGAASLLGAIPLALIYFLLLSLLLVVVLGVAGQQLLDLQSSVIFGVLKPVSQNVAAILTLYLELEIPALQLEFPSELGTESAPASG